MNAPTSTSASARLGGPLALLVLALLAIGALIAGCGGGGDNTDTGPTAAEAQQAATQLDSEIEAAARLNDKSLDKTVTCVNNAFSSGDANQVAACSPVCEASGTQCRTAATQLQTTFEAAPDYVQTAYQPAYDAALKALNDRAAWLSAVSDFTAAFPTSTTAQDQQSIQKMNALAKEATASKRAVQPALQNARAAYDTYVSGLSS